MTHGFKRLNITGSANRIYRNNVFVKILTNKYQYISVIKSSRRRKLQCVHERIILKRQMTQRGGGGRT